MADMNLNHTPGVSGKSPQGTASPAVDGGKKNA